MAKKIDPPKTLPVGRQALEKIAPSAIEISVSRNGSLKPYVACFQHLPDNIAREPLGMLAGVMMIGDKSENSAYIVNFLASLAKKEYYGNPRRGAIESFEASLHKVNVGLAELAKEGNTEWIGTLNATICCVEHNNFHFSVAGKSRVLLFRDHRLSDISDGLADESDDHPMKTFTDVASGKISPGDRILITTPEIFSALSEIELERSANRLPDEQFERFLQTALINKLDTCATVLINIGTISEYARPPAPKRILATLDSVPNAWSHAIFEASKKHGNSIEESLKEKQSLEKDRVDDKTGHIYVTGDEPREKSNETLEKIKIFFEDVWRSAQNGGTLVKKRFFSGIVSGGKNILRAIQHAFSSLFIAIHAWRQKRNLQKVFEHELQKNQESQNLIQKTESVEILEKNDTEEIEKENIAFEKAPFPDELSNKTSMRSSLSTLFSRASRSIACRLPHEGFRENIASFLQKISRFTKIISPKQKRVFLTILFLSLVLLFVVFQFTKTPPTQEEPLQNTPPSPEAKAPSPLSSDTAIRFLKEPPIIFRGTDIVEVVSLKDTVFFVTKNSLSSLGKNGGEALQVIYPDGAIARNGAAMKDLNAILIFGENGKIYFFTPATSAFAPENTTLPSEASVSDIAVFSTYLYVLDHSKDSLVRYPRAEGGFGSGTEWFKESVSIEPDTVFAVSDSVSLADTSGLRSYFRGIRKNVNFENSATPISFTDISSEEGSTSLFVLDGSAGRIIEYSTENGSILAQYASDSLQNASRFTVDHATKTAYVAQKDSVLLIEMR